jgi:shikimate dehydrogenase
MLKYLGVIGYPLSRSLSPAFQQAALDHLRLHIEYRAWPTPPDGLQTRLTTIRSPTVIGVNVTIPHKEAVLHLINKVDPLAKRIGAVNTIVNRDGRLVGYNTDSVGFMRALRQDGGLDPMGRRAVVAGAGGAARAVVAALADAGSASVSIINRTFDRAVSLGQELSSQGVMIPVGFMPDERRSWEIAMGQCDLLINCTPVASAEPSESPIPLELIEARHFVYDLIYHPVETPLMAAARKAGASVLGGLPMLVYQGAASFKLWTDHDPPVDIMFDAARKALSGEPAGKGA